MLKRIARFRLGSLFYWFVIAAILSLWWKDHRLLKQKLARYSPASGTWHAVEATGKPNTPGAGDITAGTVRLYITTDDPAGTCVSAQDSLDLTINPTATASAGADDVICEGETYTLTGAFGGAATGITWSTSGDGSFDNSALPGATYTPGAGDITAGTVTLTITSDDPDAGGPCVEATDDLVLTINALPTVTAGAGIVADSDPESEHQECINKAKALFKAAEEAERFAGQAGRGQ